MTSQLIRLQQASYKLPLRITILLFCSGLGSSAWGAEPIIVKAKLFSYQKGPKASGTTQPILAKLTLNRPLLQRIISSPTELIDAQMELTFRRLNNASPIRSVIIRLRSPTGQLATKTLALPLSPTNSSKLIPITLQHLAPILRTAWLNHQKNQSFTLTMESQQLPPSSGHLDLVGSPNVLLHLKERPKHTLYAAGIRPTNGVYVRREGSQFRYGDQRLRLWGVATTAKTARAIYRLQRLGFNALRLWPDSGQSTSAHRNNPYYDGLNGPATQLARGALLDNYDKHVATAKRAGLFVMSPFLASSIGIKVLTGPHSIVAGGTDWPAWQQAVQLAGDFELSFAATFDDRLFKGHQQHLLNVLNHRNPYTGKRYAEEETIAIWELGNERGWVARALETGFSEWTPYFRSALSKKWSTWLKHRYKTTAQLTAAWGKLEEGEDLQQSGSIALAPSLHQRGAYPEARGDDLVRFVIELASSFYERLEETARAQAPNKDVGVAVVPFSYDTQYRPNTPWHFATAGFADVASFGMYFWTTQSTLSQPPAMYVMDTHTVADKPTVIYETNAGRPNPFRVEHPYRTAVLASWQDWDAIFWHYYHLLDWPDEQYFAAELPYGTPDFYWSAVETERDPALLSAIGLAGQVFLRGRLPAAPHPVRYTLGARAIFGYRQWHGANTSRATFERGAVVDFQPTEAMSEVVEISPGSSHTFQEPLPNTAVRSGSQIQWDWPNERLIVDAPHAKVYVGRPPSPGTAYQFEDGLTISGFNTPFVAFAWVSADGRALVGKRPSQHWYLNARFDARNTNFVVDHGKLKNMQHPAEIARAIRSRGEAPIEEEPVSFTLTLPFSASGVVSGYDFATRKKFRRTFTKQRQLSYEGEALLAYEVLITKP